MLTMADFLAGLPTAELEALAARHGQSAPRSRKQIDLLAKQCMAPDLVTDKIASLSLPELQVAEVLSLRAAGTRRVDLARLLGVAADDIDLGRALDRLAWHAIAWTDGAWIRSAPLHEVLMGAYGFGPSVALEVHRSQVEQLQRIAYNIGAPVARDKRSLADAVCSLLADADEVRRLIGAAPEATRDLLLTLAEGDPYYFDPRQMGALAGHRPTPLRWAVEHGLITWTYGTAAVLPSEIGVVLREDFQADFDPAPPLQIPVEVAAELVERDGAAAVRHAQAQVVALLDECGRTPVPMLKNGGVGARELRRLAKALGGTEQELRLWLTLVGVSGLIGVTGHSIAPAAYYDDWLKFDLPTQYRSLLTAWLAMDAHPLDPANPALLRTERDETVGLLRRTMVATLCSLPEGFALPSLDGLNDLQMYLRPLLIAPDPDEALPITTLLWREMELMGVGAMLAPTRLCRELAFENELSATPGGVGGVPAQLERIIPPAQSTVLLQSDLTAVATGAPSMRLAAFLDLAADRESRGGGHTWRFSEASIRRAFDAGSSAGELLEAMREAATGGKVPQPLEYLVGDVGRRHGTVRVRPVACILRSDDTALLAELPKVRSLAKLGLTELAPTVYASVLPVGQTLAALRAAGYAPAGENADGTIALDLVTKHRVQDSP